MNRATAALLMMLIPGVGPAYGWEKMAPADLAGHVVTYDGARQSFAAGGGTIYTAQGPSSGRWRDEGGRYCSVWPPSDQWVCFRLERDGVRVRFVADDGSVTEGTID